MRLFIPMIVSLGVLLSETGGVRADEHPLQAPETKSTQLSMAVQAINNFAGDLYRQLAQENKKSNLFFSPYSVTSALTMVVEGARGETARQMGTVLRFPDATRRAGDGAQSLPWNTALMHTGMADLRQQLTGVVSTDATREIRDKIKILEQEHQALAKQERQLSEPRQGGELFAILARAANVAGELNRLRQQIDQYELDIANALWGEQTFPFRQQFIETLHDAYGAAAFPVDFVHNSEVARDRINRWVEEQTHERIKRPLGPGTLSSATRLALVNAIYFKGNWAEQFNKVNSYEGNFTLSDGAKVKAMFMSAREVRFRYAELLAGGTRNEPVFDSNRREYDFKPNPDGFQILELPYRGHTLSMIVLLPKNPENLAALETKLTADNLHRWAKAMQHQKVHVFLPKFKMETTYDLPPTLAAMGMPAAFAPGGFTNMSDAPEARNLVLSQVIHKAFVNVDEEGTEAAAATIVSVYAASARIEPPIPVFRADHPFLFLIRDTQSGAILFLGRVMNPAV
jgi:serine protease inhibitor